ncbi:MAG: CPBP family intramembrane metalloprotease [Firmicutes bacterium]|nr:CPBP family intramembrane metalloprotease [Bacillota bacterium]
MATGAWWVETAVVLYLTLVEPFYGKREYLRLVNRMAVDPAARARFYWRIVLLEWFLVALVSISLRLRREPFFRLDLTLPRSAAGAGLVVGICAGLVLSIGLSALSPNLRGRFRRQLEPVQVLLPVTRPERYGYVAVALTAGFCEEVLFRGLFMTYLSSLGPWLVMPSIVAISAAAFGFAHLYQGWKGVLGTGVLGVVLALVYVYTGSLLWPILVHALLDLRVLALLPPPPSRHEVHA